MLAEDVVITGLNTINQYLVRFETAERDQIYEQIKTSAGRLYRLMFPKKRDMILWDGCQKSQKPFLQKKDGIYTIDGKKIQHLQKGVNVIRRKDGSV